MRLTILLLVALTVGGLVAPVANSSMADNDARTNPQEPFERGGLGHA